MLSDVPAEPVYGGRTAAERHQVRREQLLQAALELAGQGGWPAVTVRGVCDSAGLTSRYFYESFRTREELALALFDELVAETMAVVLAALPDAGNGALPRARVVIGAVVEHLADDARKLTVLFSPAAEMPALTDRRIEATRVVAAVVAEQGRDFYRLSSEAATGPAATVATMLAGGLAQTLLDWSEGRLARSREQLIDECAAVFVAAGEGVARLLPATH
jgi:AcrR family transcriptional regulator